MGTRNSGTVPDGEFPTFFNQSMSPKKRYPVPYRGGWKKQKKHARTATTTGMSAAHQYVYDYMIRSLDSRNQAPWHQKDPFLSPNGNEPISLVRAQKAAIEWRRTLSETDNVLAEF